MLMTHDTHASLNFYVVDCECKTKNRTFLVFTMTSSQQLQKKKARKKGCQSSSQSHHKMMSSLENSGVAISAKATQRWKHGRNQANKTD
jgi:hypothetical protein